MNALPIFRVAQRGALVALSIALAAGLNACDERDANSPVGPSAPSVPGIDDGDPEFAISATSNSWVTLANLRQPALDLVAATANGQVYAIGGRSAHYSVYSEVEAYDPSTNQWSYKASLPAPRWGATGAHAINGKIYVPGGSADWYARPTHSDSSLFVYDIATDTWASKAALPVKTCCGASGVISGKLYVFTPAIVNGVRTFHRYNPATNGWKELRRPLHDHARSVGAVINGKFYLVGGRGGAGAISNVLEVYDPMTNTWTTKAPMPTARFGAAGRVVNGRFYVVGGRQSASDEAALSTVEVYDPATNTWATKAPMPTARYYLAAAQLNGLLYALGGWNPGASYTGLATNEAYTP